MGNAHSHVVASLSLGLCSIYFVYVKVYRSYDLLKTTQLHNDRLPSIFYLFMRYLARSLTRPAGYFRKDDETTRLEFTVQGCRLDALELRRFCDVSGYGWDYPDSEYRDIPLCFPEALCFKLLLTLLTDTNFRLSPAGLTRVRQSIRTLEPIDELKKGPFQLRASVLAYRKGRGGVEVDIGLSATSQMQRLVWESVLTLMSPNKKYRKTTAAKNENDVLSGGQLELKQVEVKVPRLPIMLCSSPEFSLGRLISALCGFKPVTIPQLWMLSICLAEIEKHKGVNAVSAPASVTAEFTQKSERVRSKVQVQFWDLRENGTQVSQKVFFNMKNHGKKKISSQSLMKGQILKSAHE